MSVAGSNLCFSDDDLKRLKEYVSRPETFEMPLNNGTIKALLARMEAAEAVIAKGCDCRDSFPDQKCCQVFEAWRKAKGEAGK